MDGKRIDATLVIAAIKNYIKRDFALSGLCSAISSEIGSDARAWVARRAKGRARLKMVQYLLDRVDEETNRLVNPR